MNQKHVSPGRDLIDARIHYHPDQVPGLIRVALEVAGTQKELAARLGVSGEYLRLLQAGERTISYSLQVALESLAREGDRSS